MNCRQNLAKIVIPLILGTPCGLLADQPPGVPPQKDVNSLAARVTELEAMVVALTEKLVCVSSSSNKTDLIIDSCNVHVLNGSGLTHDNANGLGNLIIGYNEDITAPFPKLRTGSHNLIVGTDHTYTSTGGFAAGSTNSITAKNASVCGGASNIASGYSSSVCGGVANTASGEGSSVTGGVDNTASASLSSISGGRANTASGIESSVSGGHQNNASGKWSSISGGVSNAAVGSSTSILGGNLKTANTTYQTIPPLQ